MIHKFNDRIAFYHAPKCASRTVIGWGAIIANPTVYQNNPELFSSSRQRGYMELERMLPGNYEGGRQNWELGDVVPTAPCPVRICVVRDPVDRFVSGYTNRILYHNTFGNRPSFDTFVTDYDKVIAYNQSIRHHFLTQCSFYGTDPSIFTHIFNDKQLPQLKALLEQETGLVLPDIHLQQNGNFQKPVPTAEQVTWIKALYDIDYQTFGQWM